MTTRVCFAKGILFEFPKIELFASFSLTKRGGLYMHGAMTGQLT